MPGSQSTSATITMATVIWSVMSVSLGLKLTVNYRPDNDLTCYTCPEMATNQECNRWAPEKFCPSGQTVCQTIHVLNSASGASVSVQKLCAPPQACAPERVGCAQTDHTDETVCVSCCDESYCNRDAPSDQSTALKLSTSVLTDSAASRDRDWLITTLIAITCAVVL